MTLSPESLLVKIESERKKQALFVVTRGSSPSVKAQGLYNKDGIELNPQNVDEPTVIPSIDKTAIEVVEAHLNGNHN